MPANQLVSWLGMSLLAAVVGGCVATTSNPPPSSGYYPPPNGGQPTTTGEGSTTNAGPAAPSGGGGSSWDAFLASLSAAEREKVDTAVVEIKRVQGIVNETCKSQIAWEVDTDSFRDLIASEKQKGSRYTWYSAVIGCANVMHGLRMACADGDPYRAALATKVKKLVCVHDPQALVKITHRDGPNLTIGNGELRAGYTGQAGVGVTANVESGTYEWLRANL